MNPENHKKFLVKDIMTKEVLVASPEMSLLEIAQIIAEHSFNGLPVVDKEKHVLGIITEYDLIEKASQVTLDTLQKVLRDVYASKDDQSRLKDRADEIYPLKVADIMTKGPTTISPDTSFEDVIQLFRANQKVNPLPVVDKDNKLVGIISRTDVLKPFGVVGYGTSMLHAG